MTTPHESYPNLRRVLGKDAFEELAQLIRRTYEANEERRQRSGGGSGQTPHGPTTARR